jgi:hypothetical protein
MSTTDSFNDLSKKIAAWIFDTSELVLTATCHLAETYSKPSPANHITHLRIGIKGK